MCLFAKKYLPVRHQGMTMVEMVIGLAIFVLISLAVSTLARDIFVFSDNISGSLSAQQDARTVLREFASEVRASLPGSDGSFNVSIALADEFQFYSDIDGDGLRERIRYYLSGTTLKKDILKPSGMPPQYTGIPQTKILVNNVNNGLAPIFFYYDTNYDGTTAPLPQPVNIPSIKLIKADIIIDKDPNRAPPPIVVSTQASIRILKENL